MQFPFLYRKMVTIQKTLFREGFREKIRQNSGTEIGKDCKWLQRVKPGDESAEHEQKQRLRKGSEIIQNTGTAFKKLKSKPMKQIDGHGPGSDIGEEKLFLRHEDQQRKCHQKSDPIHKNSPQNTCYHALVHGFIVVSSVKDQHGCDPFQTNDT